LSNSIEQVSFKGILQVVIGVICLGVSAQLTVDLSLTGLSIPITGQTLGVILVSYFSKKYFGIISVFIYLILGGFGLPIFADGASGWEKFSSGSGGFLIGFLVASFFLYLIKSHYDETKLSVNVFSNVMATVLILIFGVSWLSYLYGFEKGLEYGLYPFWIGAIAKVILGVGIVFGTQYFFKRSRLEGL